MIIVTVIEEGDVVVINKPTAGRPVDVTDSAYYIPKDGKLVEVQWYVASEYQNAHRRSEAAKSVRRPLGAEDKRENLVDWEPNDE